MRMRQARQVRVLLLAVPLALATLIGRTGAATQAPDGFRPLLNGRDLSGWVVENSTAGNFTVRDGVLRVEGPGGWLRSEATYGDFSLQVEVRFLTADADSGVFLRAPGPASNIFIRGWPANAYQVQVREMSVNRTTNPYWIANLYRHRVAPGATTFDADAAIAATRPVGEWQLLVIDVIADRVSVSLNGVPVTQATGIVNPTGFIGIQGETGALEYRRIDIRPR
jgi:hypothetical protein